MLDFPPVIFGFDITVAQTSAIRLLLLFKIAQSDMETQFLQTPTSRTRSSKTHSGYMQALPVTKIEVSAQPVKPPAKASPPFPGKGSGKNQKGPNVPKGKPKAKPSAASAEVEQPAAGARFCIRLKPKMKDLIAEKCFVTGYSSHSDPVGSSANAGSREPDQGYALLDSGATHVIFNLSKISPQGLREGRSICIRLARTKQI
eukprot:1100963-Amphidinium_carterae.1